MKKYNFLKYIFAVFVIALIIYAIYLNKNANSQNDVQDISQSEEENNLTTITTLRVATINLDTINPIVSTNQNVQDISKLIYEPMLSLTEDYQIEKCLAKEWISLNDTTYVVVLKEGIKWQNGGELTATDVKFTIEQIKEIGANSIYFQNVEHMTNVEVLSKYTIKITIDEKIPFFEYNLTFPIMSSQFYQDTSIINSTNNNAPGTGMYYIGDITTTEIQLKKNDTWWGLSDGRKLSLDTVIVKLYTSAGEAYNAFRLGNLDLITTQSLNYEDYVGTMGYNTAEYIGRQYDYLALNCSSTMLSNEELRKAINYAIDKSGLIASVYENKYYVADFPISDSNYLYNVEKVSSSYNTNKSKELLENAGWELNNGSWRKKQDNGSTIRARINFVVNSSNQNRVAVAEEIERQLAETGIIVNLIKASDSQYQRYLENKNYDIILTGKLIGISPDLTSYLGEGNLSQFEDEETREILEEVSQVTNNANDLQKKYSQLIKLVEDKRPYISLYFNKNTVIYTQDLQGKVTPNFYNIFYNIENWIRQY